MNKPALGIKRSQSDNLFTHSKIISPSPYKKPSKLSFHVAREVFDLTAPEGTIDSQTTNASLCIFRRPKFFSLQTELDSYNSSEWGSESSNSNSIEGDCDSPLKPGQRGQSAPDVLEASAEIVPRASNPIVRDVHFKRGDQEASKLNFVLVPVSRP